MWGTAQDAEAPYNAYQTAQGKPLNVSEARIKRPERAIRCEIGGFFGSGLDIRRRGSRLSFLPGERLFPLSGFCTHIPDFIISRLLYLASIPFFRLYYQSVPGHPFTLTLAFFHS
ncbi:hypothetical protein ATI45_2500 [Marinobacter sp. LV10MA510-1]|nr:hypothetical protein ATI45_2500 [Marinobacter sp. LV10MA510-1]PFG52032.1 hypothetical protein ATG98_1015 [Marinobacter sp. LV10R520-4]